MKSDMGLRFEKPDVRPDRESTGEVDGIDVVLGSYGMSPCKGLAVASRVYLRSHPRSWRMLPFATHLSLHHIARMDNDPIRDEDEKPVEFGDSSPANYAFLNHSTTTLPHNLPPDVDDRPLARQKRKRTRYIPRQRQ